MEKRCGRLSLAGRTGSFIRLVYPPVSYSQSHACDDSPQKRCWKAKLRPQIGKAANSRTILRFDSRSLAHIVGDIGPGHKKCHPA